MINTGTEIKRRGKATQIRDIRLLIIVFITGLALSGLSAFPIQAQLEVTHEYIQKHSMQNGLTHWLELVYFGVKETNLKYPFIAYGTDWLAFAHLVLAIAFIGPLRDPIKNVWVIQFGLIACVAIFPLALIAGEVRGIPIFWRLIDCSFGLFGGVVLWLCYRKVILFAR
jgi:hypothetical protein